MLSCRSGRRPLSARASSEVAATLTHGHTGPHGAAVNGRYARLCRNHKQQPSMTAPRAPGTKKPSVPDNGVVQRPPSKAKKGHGCLTRRGKQRGLPPAKRAQRASNDPTSCLPPHQLAF
ncbi:hypothetical protein BCR34DRAFT_573408 [Clohesyomyces aquaticus]|uniref:Uncharacterized protein n=1 Tax=Clohesyomyces aquaticus TaxID=1231657 RepID=A0A1Y1Z053_9PLEO|nr:hypothetical protein BCR34DRAFT_573408 [Clohesyomyces aquaticus]